MLFAPRLCGRNICSQKPTGRINFHSFHFHAIRLLPARHSTNCSLITSTLAIIYPSSSALYESPVFANSGSCVGALANLTALFLNALAVEFVVKLPKPSYFPKLGGKSFTWVPQPLSVLPNVSTSSLPSVKNEWSIQFFVYGSPSSVADWMKMFL